jgi:PIN domain nuclease of toxin-antitoxin system
VNYLLDTHTIIWLLENSPKLGAAARLVTAQAADRDLAISDFSLLEIALLVKKGRLTVATEPDKVLPRIAALFTVLPLSADIAWDAANLELPHGDPFDRVITATARCHRLTLITKDEKITAARLVPVVW